MIVEFAGIPKSGKTSAIDSARDYFTRKGRPVVVSPESTRACPFSSRMRFEFACWTASRVVNEVIGWSASQSDNSLMLQDRGIFDAMAFLQLCALEQAENLSLERRSHLEVEPVRLNFWLAEIDILFLFKAKPEVVLSRDIAYQLGAGTGLITNPLTIDRLLQCYDQVLEYAHPRIRNVVILDTSEKSPMAAARIVCETIEHELALSDGKRCS